MFAATEMTLGSVAGLPIVLVVPASPEETVTVMPYFDYFPGRYVFHCHAAEHGDMSMMGQMEVVA